MNATCLPRFRHRLRLLPLPRLIDQRLIPPRLPGRELHPQPFTLCPHVKPISATNPRIQCSQVLTQRLPLRIKRFQQPGVVNRLPVLQAEC